MADADFTRANLGARAGSGVSLRGMSLAGARLLEAVLEGVDLVGASLVGADLRSANLRGASLARADLTGANLRGSDLMDAILDGVIHSSDTRWPDGLMPSLAGARSYDPIGVGSEIDVPYDVQVFDGHEEPDFDQEIRYGRPSGVAVVLNVGPNWLKLRFKTGRIGFVVGETADSDEPTDAESANDPGGSKSGE